MDGASGGVVEDEEVAVGVEVDEDVDEDVDEELGFATVVSG